MASAYTKQSVRSFVNQYGVSIVEHISNTGLFFPAVVSQLSVESRWGTSGLAMMANNFGGIKGNASNGILMDTVETDRGIPTKAYFRKYPSFDAFMKDYVDTLRNDRYISAGVYTATTPQEQVRRMVIGGYSTMSPEAYLNNGIKDRISVVQDIYRIGKIGDPAQAQAQSGLIETRPTESFFSMFKI